MTETAGTAELLRLNDPVALYRLERAKAKHRRAAAAKVEMAAVQKAWREQQQRDELAGRGGRPKGKKATSSFHVPSRRMPTFAQRCAPGDELIVALGHFGGGS